MTATKSINPASPSTQDIAIASCESLAESSAMARWVLPVLAEWPAATWHMWLIDATDCTSVRATQVTTKDHAADWRIISHDSKIPAADAVCAVLGGRTGLVILAHHVVAAAALRSLDGLVARSIIFTANDPLAQSLHRPFAQFGIQLAA
jgi:hypothetical protein